MSSDCVIVVDAWKECFSHDVENHPQLPEETKAFGVYLNHAVGLIRKNFDVFHIAGGREIMDEIETEKDIVLPDVYSLPKNYDKYYFCGFHLGRCINDKPLLLHESGFDLERLGIVFNLSLLFPCDDYNSVRNISKNRGAWIPMYNYAHGIGGFTKDFAPTLNKSGE